MLLHPFVFFLIIMIGSYSFAEAQTTLMVTVAPVGIMAVTFANRYKINAEAVAQSVLWSFLMSILFIPILGLLKRILMVNSINCFRAVKYLALNRWHYHNLHPYEIIDHLKK